MEKVSLALFEAGAEDGCVCRMLEYSTIRQPSLLSSGSIRDKLNNGMFLEAGDFCNNRRVQAQPTLSEITDQLLTLVFRR